MVPMWCAPPSPVFLPCPVQALSKGDNSFLMDPRLVNCYRVRSGCSPCNNVYATARALAKVCDSICDAANRASMSGSGGRAASASVAVGVCRRLGFRLVSFGSGVEAVQGFCMSTIGGTMVFSVPARSVTVAITVNQLTASRSAVLEVVKVLCRQLRLGAPVDL